MKAEMKENAHVGRSIIEMLWEQLDVKFRQLKEEQENEQDLTAEDVIAQQLDEDDEDALDEMQGYLDYRETRGEVRGLAYAIAKLLNPYAPNVDAIREEANKRWKASH